MGFYVIKGTFHVTGYSPDGDSIKFQADNPANWQFLDGPDVALNGRNHAQLRLESIDALETHYKSTHQPFDMALDSMNFMLSRLGITNVRLNASRTRVVGADNDGARGYIISRAVESYNRPISFAYAGEPEESDWSPVFLDVERLSRSINFQSIAAGMAYPTYYKGFFSDLREAMSQASFNARNQGSGIWAHDRTTAGFSVPHPDVLETDHVILPKLFRRLAEFLDGGGVVGGFPDYLKSLDEEVAIIGSPNFPATHFTHFDSIVTVDGNVVRMTELPEHLVFGLEE